MNVAGNGLLTAIVLIGAAAGVIVAVVSGLRTKGLETTLKTQREDIDLLKDREHRCQQDLARLEGKYDVLTSDFTRDIARAVAGAVTDELATRPRTRSG